VFISHLATEKVFAVDVATALREWDIDPFVAHEDIEPTSDWRDEIQSALRSMDVLVGLQHPGYGASSWAQQEIGWAYARPVPVLIVRFGEDPRGLPAPIQWPSRVGASATAVASTIVEWLNAKAGFAERIGDGAIRALAKAGNYYDARDAGERVRELGKLTPDQLDALADAYWSNGQVRASVIASPVVRRIFDDHDLDFPAPPPGHPRFGK
jgi:hypothetical protein